MSEASEAIGDLRKICDEVKESIDPIILSSIEALIDKTYNALQDDNEEARALFEETLLRGVELVEQSKHASEKMDNLANKIVEQNIEDLLLKVGDMIDEHERCLQFSDLEDDPEPVIVTPDKTDHAYSKRISVSPYPIPKLRSRSESQEVLSPSTKSLEKLEETSKVISHNKVKKVLKTVASINPFTPRYSGHNNNVITKHIFSNKSNGGVGHIKTSITSKSVMIDLVKKKSDTTTRLDVVDVGTNTEKPESVSSVKNKKSDPPNTIVTKHTQHWTVANFNKKMKMGNGKSIDSMFFSISVLGKKSDWSLMLYPNGDKEKSAGFLSLYLTCRNRRGLETAMDFKFGLVDSEGKTVSSPSKSGSISAQMLSTNSSWGWESFVKQQDLKNNGLIINNKLTICCDITLKVSETDILKKSPHKNVVEDIRDIDALVDFVGEIASEESPKKKKGKKNKSKLVDVDKLEEEDAENEEDMEKELEPVDDVLKESCEETTAEDLNSSEFQVVTRRRRKNSQSNASTSPTPPTSPERETRPMTLG